MGPWYSLRPTSCSTLPGEGGNLYPWLLCVSFFFKGKQYIDIQYLKRSNIWSFCLLEISSFFWPIMTVNKKLCKSASLLCVRCSDADLAQYLRRGSFLEQCNSLVMWWCPVTPLLRFFCRVYFRSPGPWATCGVKSTFRRKYDQRCIRFDWNWRVGSRLSSPLEYDLRCLLLQLAVSKTLGGSVTMQMEKFWKQAFSCWQSHEFKLMKWCLCGTRKVCYGLSSHLQKC